MRAGVEAWQHRKDSEQERAVTSKGPQILDVAAVTLANGGDDIGCLEMHINVDEVDTAARRFYERHGFINIEPGADYRMLCYFQEL